ncbi:MAG: hypothetical protein ABJL99_22555 [Aliishimia sp.]
MIKFLTAVSLTFFASSALAELCPAYYRFADFGLIGNDGALYRSGPTFRTEDFDGSTIADLTATDCIEGRDIAIDGHGNPIPLVRKIDYRPGRAKLDVSNLSLARVEDATLVADDNAAAHRALRSNPTSTLTKGASALCAAPVDDATRLSCQVVTPFATKLPAVVYCDATICTITGLVVHDQIVASATWPITAELLASPAQTGQEISAKLQHIHDFLEPLTAAF